MHGINLCTTLFSEARRIQSFKLRCIQNDAYYAALSQLQYKSFWWEAAESQVAEFIWTKL